MENEIKTKKCKKCNEIKPLAEFVKSNKNKKEGVRPVCKKCVNIELSIKHKVDNPKPGSHTYDLVGLKFGMLSVLEKNGCDKYKNTLWLCKCDCGNLCSVSTSNLNRKKKLSCNCNQYKHGEEMYNFNGYKEITGAKWSSIKNNAKKRNLSFTITKEDVWSKLEKQNFLCYFTNLPISFSDKTASIDRLDSTIGYLNENIVVVHKDINRMKTDFSVDYFKKLCSYVANKN